MLDWCDALWASEAPREALHWLKHRSVDYRRAEDGHSGVECDEYFSACRHWGDGKRAIGGGGGVEGAGEGGRAR